MLKRNKKNNCTFNITNNEEESNREKLKMKNFFSILKNSVSHLTESYSKDKKGPNHHLNG